ncbi:hypothetical protein MTP99_014630 [Tenebrio molitor]|nr:hypothetical protein MTP99_014630 [Tenebrio molitor]
MTESVFVRGHTGSGQSKASGSQLLLHRFLLKTLCRDPQNWRTRESVGRCSASRQVKWKMASGSDKFNWRTEVTLVHTALTRLWIKVRAGVENLIT